MNFEEYKAEDFLLDESFQRFSIGTDQIAIDFWTGWLQKHPEKLGEAKQAKDLYLLLNGNHSAETFQKDKIAMGYLLDEYLQNSNTVYADDSHNSLRGMSKKVIV